MFPGGVEVRWFRVENPSDTVTPRGDPCGGSLERARIPPSTLAQRPKRRSQLEDPSFARTPSCVALAPRLPLVEIRTYPDSLRCSTGRPGCSRRRFQTQVPEPM